MGPRFHVHLICLVLAMTIIQGIHGIEYEVTVKAKGQGGQRFTQLIGHDVSIRTMRRATNFVWFTIFKQFSAGDRNDVRKIHLIIDSHMNEHSTYEINDGVHEIKLGARFIRKFIGEDQLLKNEITALIFYEITHILQWPPPEDQIPPLKDFIAIKDGIASYAVLSANYKPQAWVGFGDGDEWNESGSVTAQFLVYCNYKNSEFVAHLNRQMRKSSFRKSCFFDFFNKSVEDLWNDYKCESKA